MKMGDTPDRMRTSAQHFGFPFDEAHFCRRVQETVQELPACRSKVRVTLNRLGMISVTTTPLTEARESYKRITFAHERVDSDDVFLYHKTTRRGLYDEAYRRARAAGFDEVVFLNERGEVTEGSRSNILVQKARWRLPPIST